MNMRERGTGSTMLKGRFMNSRLAGQRILWALVLPVVIALAVVLTAGQVTAQVGGDTGAPAQLRDARGLFGTVVSVGEDLLVIETKSGTVSVPISEETRVRLPRKKDAGILDLAVGDLVAVSLKEVDGRLVAEKVHLVPGKTQHRHVPGVVVSVSATAIAIQPPGEAAEPISFAITPGTVTRFHRGETTLKVGAFVVVSAARDPLSGELLAKALEINVTAGKPGREP
mgnify:FL=1